VVDLPPILHATTLYVLSHCYRMFLVTNLFDMPTVMDTKEFYDILVGDYVPAENVAIIANRVSKYDRLALADLERIFGQKVFAQAPNDQRLVSAVNQGTSFMKAYSRSPLAEAIEKIADSLTREDSQTGG
jgi:Flp pilus assembly CpaE family ATPase